MAARTNADKVFVALPNTYEDGFPVLSWVLSYFPQDKTKIIITHIISSLHNRWGDCKLDRVLNQCFSHCATYKFQAEILIHIADNIAEGIVQLIAKHGESCYGISCR